MYQTDKHCHTQTHQLGMNEFEWKSSLALVLLASPPGMCILAVSATHTVFIIQLCYNR